MADSHQISSALLLSGCPRTQWQKGGKASTSHDHQQELKCLEFDGWEYHSGDCVLVRGGKKGVKLFQIETMYIGDDDKLASGKVFREVTYIEDLMAFKVCDAHPSTISFKNLSHYHPLGIYKVFEDMYVIPQNKKQFVQG